MFFQRVRKTLQKRSFGAVLIAVNKTELRYVVKFLLSLPLLFYVIARKRMASGVQLNPIEQKALAELREKGFALLNNLCDPELLKSVQKMALAKARAAKDHPPVSKNSKKDFWVRLLDEEMFSERWTGDNPFIQLSLQEPFLKILARYFADIPYLNSVFLSLSVYDSAPFKHSQLWHQDRDDTRVVKLFAYFTDVDGPQHGPFTYMDKETSRRVLNSFVPLHLSDDQLGDAVAPSDKIAVTGASCSVFMVDTSRCYHMGSRVHQGFERLLYTASFTTSPPIYGNFDNHIKSTENLSLLQKKSIEFAYRK